MPGKATFWRVAGLYVLGALVALALVLAVALPAGGAVLATFAATDATAPRVAVAVLAALAALAGLLVLLLPLVLIQQHAVRELVLGGARARWLRCVAAGGCSAPTWDRRSWCS